MVDIVTEQIRGATEIANALWTGTRYVVLAAPDYAGLASGEISQIVFSPWRITYRETSALSSRQHRVPVRADPGTVAFRGATIRNTDLYKSFDVQEKYLSGSEEVYEPKNMMIFTYDTTKIQMVVPISIIVLIGCVPVSYKPADADANGTTIPLEELVVQPHRAYRISGDLGLKEKVFGSVSSF